MYSKDIRKFHKKYVLKEDEEDVEDSDFIRMGNLVDVIKTDKDNFDKYFVITKAVKPTGQLFTFTTELFKLKKASPNSELEPLISQAYRLLEESNGGKVRDKVETFIKNFNEKAISFFQELINSDGKTVVTIDEATIAEEIVKKINTCEAFAPKGDETLRKHAIFFTVGDEPFKAEIDEMDIDHKNKIVYPYDYKITSFVNEFVWNGFLKNNYWIQSGLYKFAIQNWLQQQGLEGYRVENMAFKVADQANYYEPLLYKTTDQHFEGAWNGFYVGRNYKKGIYQIINEINESRESNRWGISVENLKNKSEVWIPDFKQELDY
jgi:hypothetical protein